MSELLFKFMRKKLFFEMRDPSSWRIQSPFCELENYELNMTVENGIRNNRLKLSIFYFSAEKLPKLKEIFKKQFCIIIKSLYQNTTQTMLIHDFQPLSYELCDYNSSTTFIIEGYFEDIDDWQNQN